jgi:hypothetical protein
MALKKQKILFITGSINQTSQMHQIAARLPEFDCWFSQLFSDNKWLNFLIKYTSLGNRTILAGQFRANSEKYLRNHGLNIDYTAQKNNYDLVVYCTDVMIPRRMQQNYTIWVQEGMVDKYTWLSKLVQTLGLPPSVCGDTSLNGSTNICDVYCAASEGYKEYFAGKGTDPSKIVVTGMPNYDDLEKCRNNDFPHKDYVMAATTDFRETYRYENRSVFIKKALKMANGRRLLFKLHPNEKVKRAENEIRKYAPADTLIYSSGNTNEMIANCCELITQYSTVVYTGIVLGKKVHSLFDVDELERLSPLQNGGHSATLIANLCRDYLNKVGEGHDSKFILGKKVEPALNGELILSNNYA